MYLGKEFFAAGVLGRGDIYELSINALDLVVKNKLNENLDFNFSIKNLLNPSTRLVQEVAGEEFLLTSFKRGQTISLGISYKFL